VLTTDREHHSNLVPWQRLAARGVRHEVVPSREDGTLDLDAFDARLAHGDVRLVAAVHVSNLDGYVAPVKDLVDVAHHRGARVLLDGAQAAPHVPVDLARLGADHYAVSVHKMLGPTGVGALVSRPEALAELEPFLTGGDTVARTTYAEAEFLDGPARFEAGRQNYAGLAGVRPALDLLRRVGMQDAKRHGRALARRAALGLDGAKGLTLVGAPLEARVGIVPLALDAVDPHALAILLEDKHRVMVRSGDHCLHAWFNARGVPGAVRMSTHVYTSEAEVDRFVDGTRDLLSQLQR
jgi:cysteine desulfurase/selenocysteine lyase